MNDMKLEVAILPVADVDRTKDCYAGLGRRLDADGGGDGSGGAANAPGSSASIIFGSGVTSAQAGSVDRLFLAVDDIAAAREKLISQGADVGQSYAYASFADPDGNRWMLEEITERAPGR